MDKYFDADRKLAELRYRRHLRWEDDSGGYTVGWYGDQGEYCGDDRPCRDWSAAGPLISEYELDIDWGVNAKHVVAIINTIDMYYKHQQQMADHPDRDTAVRYAIVQAVTAKLEAGHTIVRAAAEAGKKMEKE